MGTMNFSKLASEKKKSIADEVYEWYEKKYQIEIPEHEKQEFYLTACYDPSGWQSLEQFYNVYLAVKSASEETVHMQKKVESRQVEDERLEAEEEVLTELGLEINESETTFAGSDNSMDVNGQINNLKKIVQQSAIGQNDDFVNAAESTCNEIRSLTEKLTTELGQIRTDLKDKKQFEIKDLVQNDEMENGLQIIKKCCDSLKSVELEKRMIKEKVVILKRFIAAIRKSRSKIKGAIEYYGKNPERLERQERTLHHDVAVLREQHQMKIKNTIANVKNADNPEFSDTILRIFAGQLENEVTLVQNCSTELDYFKKLQDMMMTLLENFVDIIRCPHVMNSFRSSLIRDLTEFTEKLNASIKKELRRRSDNANLRGFISDDDEIGHLLAKHYDLEHDQNSIVPVVQKKRICESLQDDLSKKADAKLKLLQQQTAILNLNISNIDKNLSDIPVPTDRLEKLVNFDCDKRVDDTTRSRFTSRTTFSTTVSVNDQTEASFLEKSRLELDDYQYQIEMLLEKWDKEKSAQGLNLHLATQQFSLEIAKRANIDQ